MLSLISQATSNSDRDLMSLSTTSIQVPSTPTLVVKMDPSTTTSLSATFAYRERLAQLLNDLASMTDVTKQLDQILNDEAFKTSSTFLNHQQVNE